MKPEVARVAAERGWTLDESAQTPALSVTHAPIGKGGKNWITKTAPGNSGQLPAYIQNIRNAMIRDGHPESEATALAIGAVKRWASGGGGVSDTVKAAAAKAVAEWEALRGKSKARDAAKKVDESALGRMLTDLERRQRSTAGKASALKRHRHAEERAGMLSGPLPADRDALHKHWADLDRALLPYVGRPDHPVARQIIARQKQVTSALHHMKGLASPGTTSSDEGVHDVAIVGAGPAGLSASIYGGTEGLDTVMLEGKKRAGGQAGLSSRIENVIGFPAGISGRQLAASSLDQAERTGADMRFGHNVEKMEYDPVTKIKTLHMDDGTKVRAKAVVIAGGVKFRKVGFEGESGDNTVYGDSTTLKNMGRGEHVAVIGGANSAGQAAIDAAQSASHVHILLRHGHIEDQMSDYLVKQIQSDPKISVEENATTDHAEMDGDGHMKSLVLKDGRKIKAAAVGAFIGAAPKADWAGVERDKQGYVKTGGEGRHELETSIPGVFAAGDIRSGSMHRVISAGGDGAHAIAAVHPFIASMEKPDPQGKLFEAKADKPKAPAKPDEADAWMDKLDQFDQQQPYTGGDGLAPGDEDYGDELAEALHLEVHRKDGVVHRRRFHSRDSALKVKRQLESQGHKVKLLEGEVRSKYDDMDEHGLRRLAAKYKAMGDKAPAEQLLRVNQALARKLTAAWEQFESAQSLRESGLLRRHGARAVRRGVEDLTVASVVSAVVAHPHDCVLCRAPVRKNGVCQRGHAQPAQQPS